MATIDTDRNNVLKKRGELSKLYADKAKEIDKQARQEKKIASIKNALKHTSSQSLTRSKTSEIEKEAMRWAVENGVINGYGNERLNAQGQATRAEIAQMLKNFIER